MSHVRSVYEISKQLLKILNEHTSINQREAAIKEIEQILEQRELLISKISPPYSEEEISYGKKVVKLNDEIEQLMSKWQVQLKDEMRNVKKQKSSATSYINPYKDVRHLDGMFLDQKK